MTKSVFRPEYYFVTVERIRRAMGMASLTQDHRTCMFREGNGGGHRDHGLFSFSVGAAEVNSPPVLIRSAWGYCWIIFYSSKWLLV